MTLKELKIGKSAVIKTVGGSGELRQHFLDMGMIPGAEVTVVKLAPMGDPMELQVHGYELTLRLAVCHWYRAGTDSDTETFRYAPDHIFCDDIGSGTGVPGI